MFMSNTESFHGHVTAAAAHTWTLLRATRRTVNVTVHGEGLVVLCGVQGYRSNICLEKEQLASEQAVNTIKSQEKKPYI